MLYIYILLLQYHKFYIGTTNDPLFNINDHINNQWTNKFEPVKILDIISNCKNGDENNYTLKYMYNFGINNVRGGKFSQMNLSEEEINNITLIINSTNFNINYNCNDYKLEDFMNNLDSKDLNTKLKELNILYNELLEIKEFIFDTELISLDDLDQIKREAKIEKELRKLYNELRLLEKRIELKNIELTSQKKINNIYKNKNNYEYKIEKDNKIFLLSSKKNYIDKLEFELRELLNNYNNVKNGLEQLHEMRSNTKYYISLMSLKDRLEDKYNYDFSNKKDAYLFSLEVIKERLIKKNRLIEIMKFGDELFIYRLLEKLYKENIFKLI